ncbi:MAG: sigma-70 family RNA polymerase sigma factor [Vulcanimicrobiaceae bacterium]
MVRAQSDPSDEALLRRIARRDETAFHVAYRRHSHAVMAVSYRFLGDRESAAEVTQQTFLRLWDRAPSVGARTGRLRPWLVIVARNMAIDIGRRRRLHAVSFDRLLASVPTGPDVADSVIERIETRDARDLLAVLGEDQRRIVELAYFGELTQTEIATVLEIPLGTVKSRLRLALQRLRDHVRAIGWESK